MPNQIDIFLTAEDGLSDFCSAPLASDIEPFYHTRELSGAVCQQGKLALGLGEAGLQGGVLLQQVLAVLRVDEESVFVRHLIQFALFRRGARQ